MDFIETAIEQRAHELVKERNHAALLFAVLNFHNAYSNPMEYRAMLRGLQLAHTRALEEAITNERAQCVRLIEGEPSCEGPVPDDIAQKLIRLPIQSIVRATIQTTKDELIKKIKQRGGA